MHTGIRLDRLPIYVRAQEDDRPLDRRSRGTPIGEAGLFLSTAKRPVYRYDDGLNACGRRQTLNRKMRK